MDLNHVAVFVRVVEASSFTKAGVELGLPKSSISRTVASLEESLGVQLLQRTTRKLNLTEAGREYFAQAQRVLTELNQAAVAVSQLGTESRGIVRITAPVDLGSLTLADIIARFTTKYSRIHIELSLTARRVDLVAEGYDIALRAANRLTDSSLVAIKVGSTDFGLFAARSYLERRGMPRTAKELTEHSCVLFRGHNGSANWQLVGPSGPENLIVKGPVNVDEMLFVAQAVQAGIGIGLLPLVDLLNAKARDDVLRILPNYGLPGASLFVVTPEARHRPARVTLFRDFLIASLRALPWMR